MQEAVNETAAIKTFKLRAPWPDDDGGKPED
jgi:hypothetical protein